MPELLADYWYLVLAALVLAIAIIWWLYSANRKTRVEIEDKPAEAGGAKRNQALIDAPPAAVKEETVSVAIPEPETAEAAQPAPAAVPTPAPAPAPAASDDPDDLRRIKGLGPKLVALLAEQGVTSFAQIAEWDDAEIDRIDATLGRFEGRIRRDDWVAQAKLLAADDMAGYEARFGKL